MDDAHDAEVVELLQALLAEVRALREETERQREILERMVEALAMIQGSQFG